MRARDLIGETFNETGRDRVTGRAAEIAFWSFLSLVPMLIALTSMLRWLGPLAGNDAESEAESAISSGLRAVLGDESDEPVMAVERLFDNPTGTIGITAFVGLALSIWAVSRSFHAAIAALDEAYNVQNRRNWFGVRALSLGLAAGSVAVAAATSTLLVVLPGLANGLLSGNVLWPIARGMVAVLLVFSWALVTYHIAPNHHTPWRGDLPGATVATIGWFLAAGGFRYYVRWASQPGADVVGALGGVLSLLLLLWLLALVLLIGGEVNGVLAQHRGYIVHGDPTLSTVDQIRKMRDWTTGRHPVVDVNNGPPDAGEPVDVPRLADRAAKGERRRQLRKSESHRRSG